MRKIFMMIICLSVLVIGSPTFAGDNIKLGLLAEGLDSITVDMEMSKEDIIEQFKNHTTEARKIIDYEITFVEKDTPEYLKIGRQAMNIYETFAFKFDVNGKLTSIWRVEKFMLKNEAIAQSVYDSKVNNPDWVLCEEFGNFKSYRYEYSYGMLSKDITLYVAINKREKDNLWQVWTSIVHPLDENYPQNMDEILPKE